MQKTWSEKIVMSERAEDDSAGLPPSNRILWGLFEYRPLKQKTEKKTGAQFAADESDRICRQSVLGGLYDPYEPDKWDAYFDALDRYWASRR